MATRYDKLDAHHLASVRIASITLWHGLAAQLRRQIRSARARKFLPTVEAPRPTASEKPGAVQ
ncbi:hypothetical protein D3869_10770 [Azospirillum brasilense]|uniref:Uncharacterized protein n=1 Tax=Azospirillum brasilense TaxID=192 RepID=A0A4D8R4I0_AZOBR|nr:hypothetical protein [Azospirillum brasilense]QCO15673.1 hypothetical protein D3869_10770 [Azospirillum brasilense]